MKMEQATEAIRSRQAELQRQQRETAERVRQAREILAGKKPGPSHPRESDGIRRGAERTLVERPPGAEAQAARAVAKAEAADLSPVNEYNSPTYWAKVDRFERQFGEKARPVVEKACSRREIDRVGASHHMDVANALGPDKIAAFEDPFKPTSSSGRLNHVDIVTKDGVAVECKNVTTDAARPEAFSGWFRQAERRLEPNEEGKKYAGVVIAVPDGKLTPEVRAIARRYEASYPGIRVCEVHEVQRAVSEVRAVKARGA